MPREPRPLVFRPFGVGDPLDELAETTYAKSYLRCYLADLAASVIIEEPYYFDRDYLAEFSAFYSTSARGYSNVCRRLHFFGGQSVVTRELVTEACGGNADAVQHLQEAYLGFTVLRPFEPPRLGRTVLAWYPDIPPDGMGPRVTEPSRDYVVHLAGLRLKVHGIAWQQQDMSVGACATVALWSMLHSSAFDDHHAVPTTADITRAAHRHGSSGSRVFPSSGLTPQQLGEAVQEHDLSPLLLEGDLHIDDVVAFSRERLASTLAAFVRSGYPVLVGGMAWHRDGRVGGGHAVCVTGFRSSPPPSGQPAHVVLADGETQYVYLHDDNLGPNVRFEIGEADPPWVDRPMPDLRREVGDEGDDTGAMNSPPPPPVIAVLTASSPAPRGRNTGFPDPTPDYPRLIPSTLLVAVHNELRTSPDRLHREGLQIGKTLGLVLAKMADGEGLQAPTLTMSTRFIGVRKYMRDELPRVLSTNPAALARVRLGLVEKVPPMSLHLGLVRLGLGTTPLVDILYDTTDSELHLKAFASVAFAPGLSPLLPIIARVEQMDLGVQVDGS